MPGVTSKETRKRAVSETHRTTKQANLVSSSVLHPKNSGKISAPSILLILYCYLDLRLQSGSSIDAESMRW